MGLHTILLDKTNPNRIYVAISAPGAFNTEVKATVCPFASLCTSFVINTGYTGFPLHLSDETGYSLYGRLLVHDQKKWVSTILW
jgi:hypothetical protein